LREIYCVRSAWHRVSFLFVADFKNEGYYPTFALPKISFLVLKSKRFDFFFQELRRIHDAIFNDPREEAPESSGYSSRCDRLSPTTTATCPTAAAETLEPAEDADGLIALDSVSMSQGPPSSVPPTPDVVGQQFVFGDGAGNSNDNNNGGSVDENDLDKLYASVAVALRVLLFVGLNCEDFVSVTARVLVL
jgi:hypothetical protein